MIGSRDEVAGRFERFLHREIAGAQVQGGDPALGQHGHELSGDGRLQPVLGQRGVQPMLPLHLQRRTVEPRHVLATDQQHIAADRVQPTRLRPRIAADRPHRLARARIEQNRRLF